MALLSLIGGFNEDRSAYQIEMRLESALIEVKETTWTIDGDQLKFQGLLIAEGLKEEVIVRYTVASEKEKENLSEAIPSFLSAEGELRVPNSRTNFNQFDYQLYLKRQNIAYIMHAERLTEIKEPYFFLNRRYKIDAIRQNLLDYCDESFQPVTSSYIKALIFGDRRELSEDITAAFRNLGIIHLLSISGLHISLLIVLTEKLLTRLTVSRESSRVILLIILPLFGAMAGFGISVFRAVVQAWVRCFSDCQKWSLTSLDCWSLAMAAALMVNPSVIFSIGFQLSYTMSFLILFVSQSPFFSQYTLFKRISFLNIILFLASIPILSYHYYEFSLGILLLNSFYVPFVSYVLMPGLLFLLVMSPLFSRVIFFSVIERGMILILTVLEQITTLIDESVSLTFISGRLASAVIILWVIVLIYALIVIEQKKPTYYLMGTGMAFIMLLHVARFSPLGQIVMLDVGQGDSILIKEPFNKGNHLIDTGGTAEWGSKENWQIRNSEYSLGMNVVVPVMKSFGINRLDSIIITHPHWDHYGELADIVNGFSVGKISSNHFTFSHASFEEELLKINDHSIALEIFDEKAQGDLSQNLFLINDEWVDDSNLNNQSVVLVGKYGKLVWLFTGDIEKEREKSILSQFPDLKVDVLKVSHHGSATSTQDDFMKQVEPDYALISVGRNNRYGHPHQETIDRLSEHNTVTYRTDIHGSILYTYSEYDLIDQWLRKNDPFTTINKGQGVFK